jgi:hypothetical protein
MTSCPVNIRLKANEMMEISLNVRRKKHAAPEKDIHFGKWIDL